MLGNAYVARRQDGDLQLAIADIAETELSRSLSRQSNGVGPIAESWGNPFDRASLVEVRARPAPPGDAPC